MSEQDRHPVLLRLERSHDGSESVTESIPVDKTIFSIGRNDHASYPIYHVAVSRQHCILKQIGDNWYIKNYSKFGTRLNGTPISKENENDVELKCGDILTLDCNSIFKYQFCESTNSGQFVTPPCKKIKISEAKSDNRLHFEQNCNQRRSEMQSKLQAVRDEQSQIQEEELHLKNSYEMKIIELERKFDVERRKMENRAEKGEEQQKIFNKQRKEMEQKLLSEKEELKSKFEMEKQTLQLKVEEQRKVEERLKEDNEKLQAQIEAERKEFELQLAEERRQLEESSAEARRKAENERAELEKRLQESLAELKEQQEKEKNKFYQQLEQGTLDKQKLEEEHERVMKQLRDQELSAAQQLDEKQKLEQKLQQMEQVLKEKEEQQKALSDELARKEEENKKELETLRAKQEAENQRIREEMHVQEQAMRSTLDGEISKLQSEKLKLEADIRVEMNVESLENKHKYETELEKVKKQLELMESKKQVLEMELATNNQEKEKITENCLQTKQKLLEEFGELMQSELQCQICSELFVIATTLNCMHTFCKICITEWKRKQTKAAPDCPVCRATIVSENRSIVLDNFIDKMVESLSDDLKEQRKQLLVERGVLAGPSKPIASTSKAQAKVPIQQNNAVLVQQGGQFLLVNATTRQPLVLNMPPGGGPARQRGGAAGRRRAQAPAPRATAPAPRPTLNPVHPQGPQNNRNVLPTVVQPNQVPQVGAEVEVLNERITHNQNTRPNYDSDESNSDDEIVVPGLSSAGYGGYGRCYNCGMKGHWAPGCPFGSRR